MLGGQAGEDCATCEEAGYGGEGGGAPGGTPYGGTGTGTGTGAEGGGRDGVDPELGGGASDGGVAGALSAGEGGAAGNPSVTPEPACIECARDPLCLRAEKCGPPPSCVGLAATCGGLDDCCASPLVPAGSFNRGNDSAYPATVSAFRLDKYEVTVGRFRKFVDAYSQNIVVHGAGRNPHNSQDPGWSGIWSTLPADKDQLLFPLKCGDVYQTWTDAPGANENLPMTCLSSELANAFCTWDGGRVPTEAEWNYAAAGGDQQRKYPWGDAPPGESSTLALFGDQLLAPVGSISAGQGRWGHADLAGNVAEWTRDAYFTYPVPCQDCTNLDSLHTPVVRGGGVRRDAEFLMTSQRSNASLAPVGVRCARPVLPDSCSTLPETCAQSAACCGPERPRGAFTLTLAAPYPAPIGKYCPTPGAVLDVPAVQTPAEKLTLTSYERVVTDGEGGAVVQCSVVQQSPLVLSALIRTDHGLLELDNVSLVPDEGYGNGRGIVTGFPSIYQLDGLCGLKQLEIETGEPPFQFNKIHGALECLGFGGPPTTECPARGVFVLENCREL